MLKRMYHFERGFTLIELIVSIGILAILSVFIITALNPYEQFLKAQDTRRKSDLAQIQKALEAYYQDNGRYPFSTGGTGNGSTRFRIKTSEPPPDDIKDWGTNWSPYIQILPKDIGTQQYLYVVDSTGQSYWLYTSLQRGKKDPQSCAASGQVKGDHETCINVPNASTCDSSNSNDHLCNYGVSSSNVSP